MKLDDAIAVANAVLFEGYALYPYRASSPKNRYRWQFGVLAPRGWSEGGGGEAWWQETQALVAPRDADAHLQGTLRFLQLRRREVGMTGGAPPWDEGDIQQVELETSLAKLASEGEHVVSFRVAGHADLAGGVRAQTWPIAGAVRVTTEPVVSVERPLFRLCVRVENLTAWLQPGETRDEALRASLLGTHLFLGVEGGELLSVIDPPTWAVAAAAQCRNVRTFPVLVGPPDRRDLLLSAPVILEDHPRVAPESPRDLFDATEIDEILSLRILTLTDAEKREMRATDPRLAALLDGVEQLGPEGMTRLHGATRELHPLDDPPPAARAIDVGGVPIGAGSRVRLRPGSRRTDAQDIFLAGLTATVETVLRDVDGCDVLAVTIDDDPARELLRWQRRFHHFYPDEVEPFGATGEGGA